MKFVYVEKDEDDAFERQRQAQDDAYAEGFRSGVLGFGTAGRDEHYEEHWLEGYRAGLAKFLKRAA